MSLFSGPTAGNEVSKMLKYMDEGNALIREVNEAENKENDDDKLNRKRTRHKEI